MQVYEHIKRGLGSVNVFVSVFFARKWHALVRDLIGVKTVPETTKGNIYHLHGSEA